MILSCKSYFLKRILTLCFAIYLTFFLLILRVLISPTQYQWSEDDNIVSLLQIPPSKRNETQANASVIPLQPKVEGGFLAWDYDEILDSVKAPLRNITILMWTEYYHNKDLTDHVRNEAPIPSWCNVTFDRKKLNSSQAVVFHIPGTDLNLGDLPPRDPSQLWVYYIIEPPLYMNRPTQTLDRLFNRTMTYRLDSDYPCPYGYIAKRRTPLSVNPYLAKQSLHSRSASADSIILPPLEGKKKPVAWMVSHCNTFSRRENLVRQLEKHIPIDIYGSCGKLSCDKQKEEGCYEKLGRQYKFYLSFENSICSDYITEKFSNALKYNLVPIVYGGGNYTKILLHPKSFINVRDYDSAEDLAKYLHYLDQNDTAYAQYFEWRKYYDIHIRQGFAGFRRMCYALQAGDQGRKHVYSNIGHWWNELGHCKSEVKLIWS